MAEPTTITLKNQLSELERVSRLVEAFGERQGLPAKLTFELNLALDEILTNVISYAYDDDRAHDIRVRLSLAGSELAVEVEDDGRAFDPLAVPAPKVDAPAEERPVGGLGIHLVRKLMDGLEYRRRQDKNLLLMTKSVAGSR